MCFSATASFTASAAIGVVAAVCLRQAKNPGGYLVACMPLSFSVQQAVEGVLWMALMHPAYRQWQGAATFGFLLFAQVVWPLLVPLMVWALEKEERKKNLLALFLVPGGAIGLYFLWSLFAYPATPLIISHHIKYRLNIPGYNNAAATGVYLIATIIPPLISGHRPVRWLGMILLVSMLATHLFYTGLLISVWCFFAALLSVVCVLIIRYLNHQRGRLQPSPVSGDLP